jgi:response regulator RpfG family c-di-GMP phosphodiesterase
MAATELRQSGRAARPRMLCVDDDAYVLEGLRDVLGRSFDVRTAVNGLDGLAMLKREPDAYAMVLSDMRMPVMNGAEFLRAARVIAPDAVRMLLTGQADIESASRAVNQGQLFRFLIKPCESQELMRACAAALGQHRLHTAERVVLEQTVRGSVDALTEVLALINPAAFGRGGRVKTLAGALARAAALPDWWAVEVAAMLAHLGAVTLPQATAEKLYAGADLTPEEAAMVRRVPLVTRQLVGKIPRLEGVLDILDKYPDAVAGATADGASGAVPAGARVLRIAVDYAQAEARGVSADVALGVMRGRGVYDPDLLERLLTVVGVGAAARIREVALDELEGGMTLADDARSIRGELLVARGQHVTAHLLERLVNLGSGHVREPLRVFATDRPA